MIIRRYRINTGFVSVSRCILLFSVGFTISLGYVSYIYLERSFSNKSRHVMASLQGRDSTATSNAKPGIIGNMPVIAHLYDKDSTVTNAKPEFIRNMHVMANLESNDSTVTITKPELIGSDKMKTLLWYDTAELSMVRLSTKARFSQCIYKNCQYKQFLTKTDSHPKNPFDAAAILIQAADINQLSPPPRRDEDQPFVLAVRDSFYRSETDTRSSRKWSDLFNWTMTYRLDSDFVFPYAMILKRENKTNLVYKNYDRIFERKNNKAVWFVSHCMTSSRREHYVREMQNVMGIDIFGGCGRDPPCPKKTRDFEECHEQTAKKYKFYLAFENTFVEDYVSEKPFHWLNRDIIVVVRGGANYSRILPKGSVVDAGDFETPTKLGQYLAELAQDKVRYIEYLMRKDMYYATSNLEPAQEGSCKLCEYLNNLESHKKRYSNITEWWMKGWKNYDMQREDLEGWPRNV